MSATNVPMSQLATRLSRLLGQSVVDETQQPGFFDFQLTWAVDSDRDVVETSVLTALQEQLGLKLEARKVSQETLILEHAERPPQM